MQSLCLSPRYISRCPRSSMLASRCSRHRHSEIMIFTFLGRSWISGSASIGHDALEATTRSPVSDIDALAPCIHDARCPDRRGRPSNRGSRRRLPNLHGDWPCSVCGEFKPSLGFYTAPTNVGFQSSCKSCALDRQFRFNRTLRGNVKQLLGSARHRSRLKGLPFELSRDDILDMLWNQRGRCSYSGIEVEYLQPNSHWRASLERICNYPATQLAIAS